MLLIIEPTTMSSHLGYKQLPVNMFGRLIMVWWRHWFKLPKGKVVNKVGCVEQGGICRRKPGIFHGTGSGLSPTGLKFVIPTRKLA